MAANNTETSVNNGKKRSFSRLLLILLVVLLAGNVFFYFKQSAASSIGSQLVLGTSSKTEIMDMGELVVNLNGGGHYLRVQIALEYPKNKKLSKELQDKKTQTLDVIITTLRSKTLEDVNDVNKINGLKSSLLEEINKTLDNGKVRAIYFTDYLVQ